MELLKFSDAISNSSRGLSFPGVAAFDEYFSFSGKRYRVIEACTVNRVSGYRVESYEVKQNIPLNILKVISIMTLIIPIIMGIGKLIARNHYRFFIEARSKSENEIPTTEPNKTDVKNSKQPQVEKRKETSEIFTMHGNSSENLKNHKIIQPIVHPATPDEIRDRLDKIQEFKKKALELFHQSKSVQKNLDFTLNQSQKENLETANWEKFRKSISVGKIVRGGGNFVFFLNSVPGFVFKPMEDKASGEEYIETVQKARQLVAENNLYLLNVPEAKLIEVNGHWYVMQEKADLIFSSHKEQKGVYTSCWNDEKMTEFMKTVFSQLLFFISRSQFSDVKYDNIPFTSEGKIALIDLDERSCVYGLAYGRARKNDGLFNYIPPEYLSHFFQCAKSQLNEQDYRELEPEFIKIKERAEKKLKKDKDYSDFSQKNSIFCPSQNINSDLPNIFTENEKQAFAKFMIEHINQKLSSERNFSIKFGRTLSLDINIGDSLEVKAKELWGSTLPYSLSNFSFKTLLTEVLDGLKNAGYLFNYKVSWNYHTLKVIC